MTTRIKIKKGAGTPSGLTFGELAYDVTNKRLFIGITGGNALLANTDGGVALFNGLTGGVTLAAGTNITLTPVGNTITIASSGGGGAGVTYYNFTESATAPTGLSAGDRWFDTNTGKLFTAITDGASRIWVEFGGVGTKGATGAAAVTNSTTQTLDFTETINGLEVVFYGTGVDLATSLKYIENYPTIVARIRCSDGTKSCVLDSIQSFYDSTNGWSARIVVKPPFVDTGSFVDSTAETIISQILDRVTLDLTSSAGVTITDRWTNIVSATVYHQEETYVTKTVTGQTWVAADSYIECKVLGLTTADHTPEDAILEGVKFEINNILGGTGFDIIGHAPEGTYGKYTIKCLGQ